MPCSSRAAGALAALLAFVPLWSANADAAGQDDNPVALLRASIAAPKSVSYVGQFENVRFSSNRATATIVKVEHRAPAATRRWYVAPEALYGDYIITRGTTTYEFDTKRAKEIVSHDPQLDNEVASAASFERVMRNYRAILDGDATIAERPTISVELLNKYTGERAERVWIDRRTHLVLKKEEYHANGSVASQTRFEELRYTDTIPEDIFSTDTPAGYSRVTGPEVTMLDADIDHVIAQAGFKPIEPQSLPQGFTETSGGVGTVNGVRTLHLLYSDGLRSISLFENATGAAADFGSLRPKTIYFEGHDAQYVEDGPTTLLTWKEHGLYFALVGDLMRSELVEIAKSVVP